MNPIYQRSHFLTSAHELAQLPPDDGLEVAFAGRSNSGKSSAINVIARQKNLARTSKTPGRTQAINVFQVCDGRFLVDLPGYGYAKVPEVIRRHWQRTLPAYLGKRHSLAGLMLIMDIRHPLTAFDQQMLIWCRERRLPIHILLTKADKISRGQAAGTLQTVLRELRARHPGCTAQTFSALRQAGVDEAHARLDTWLELGEKETGTE